MGTGTCAFVTATYVCLTKSNRIEQDGLEGLEQSGPSGPITIDYRIVSYLSEPMTVPLSNLSNRVRGVVYLF